MRFAELVETTKSLYHILRRTERKHIPAIQNCPLFCKEILVDVFKSRYRNGLRTLPRICACGSEQYNKETQAQRSSSLDLRSDYFRVNFWKNNHWVISSCETAQSVPIYDRLSARVGLNLPSSRVTLFMLKHERRMMSLPTSLDPVNAIFSSASFPMEL